MEQGILDTKGNEDVPMQVLIEAMPLCMPAVDSKGKTLIGNMNAYTRSISPEGETLAYYMHKMYIMYIILLISSRSEITTILPIGSIASKLLYGTSWTYQGNRTKLNVLTNARTYHKIQHSNLFPLRDGW